MLFGWPKHQEAVMPTTGHRNNSPHPSIDIRPEDAWDLESFLSPKKPMLTFGISDVSYFLLDFSPHLLFPPHPSSIQSLICIKAPHHTFPASVWSWSQPPPHLSSVHSGTANYQPVPLHYGVLRKHPFSFLFLFSLQLLCSISQHIVLSTCLVHMRPQYSEYRLSFHIFLPH